MKRHRKLLRFTLAGLVSLPVLAAAPQTVAFDVSTVKSHNPADGSMSWYFNENGFRASNVALKSVIADAWDVRSDQVMGEPSWADDLQWDVTGKSTELTSAQAKKLTHEQREQMMQQLLAERFHLSAHLETRTGPVFTLLPAKGGIKLNPIAITAEQKADGKVPASGTSMGGTTTLVMKASKVPLSTLLRNLAVNLHQTVIDKSGLPADAVYDFTLRWAPDHGITAPDSDALPLPAALQDQLGLHLEAGRGPVQVLVVDHVDKPAPN